MTVAYGRAKAGAGWRSRADYPAVKGAKVVTDRMTGWTKGYGFDKFGGESEQLRAIMGNSVQPGPCALALLLIRRAFKMALSFRGWELISAEMVTYGAWPYLGSYQNTQGTQNEDEDPNNTTIFVCGLNDSVSEDQLGQVFSPYGQIIHVKIPAGKRCGFVQFADRRSAEEALRLLNGTQLGGQNIRLSWGCSPSNKQPQVDQNQWNGGYYGFPQGYETYGYAPATQDPNLYYGSYPVFGNYQQPPPQPQQL